MKILFYLFSIILCIASTCARAGGEWYFSWGYSKDYWAGSNINVYQRALNNNFTVYNVQGGDDPGWNHPPYSFGFGGQYNIRIGRFVDAAQTWALELSLDHTKYNSTPNQVAYVGGIVNGQYVGSYQTLTPMYFSYFLHNGLNHVMLNAVKRIPLFGVPNNTMSVAAVVKVGAGVLIPHSLNVIFGQVNNVGPKAWRNYFGWNSGWWQFGGWTAGVEAGFRIVLYKPIYLELTDKEAFSGVSQIPVNQGRANQALWLNEVIFSLGIAS